MTTMEDLDSVYDPDAKKYAMIWGQNLGPMHTVLAYLFRPSKKNKDFMRIQMCQKRMYNVIVPNFRPTLPFTARMLGERELITSSEKSKIKLTVREKGLEWIIYGLITRMVLEDYYDIVYQGIEYHYHNELNWGKPAADIRYFQTKQKRK